MIRVAILIVLTLISSFSSAEENSLQRAEKLFKATLYGEAIPVYRLALEQDSYSQEEKRTLKLHLGQALLLSACYQEAIHQLTEIQENPNAIELLSKCYLETKHYARAIAALQKIDCSERVYFEKGLIYFKWNKIQEAQKHFEIIWKEGQDSSICELVGLYLARTYIAQNLYPEALEVIAILKEKINESSDFLFEIHFLSGEMAYQQQRYEDAAEFFARSIPAHNMNKAQWTEEALLYLGWSHLKLGLDTSIHPTTITQHLNQSEDAFLLLLKNGPNEQALLALGQCYLARATLLDDKNAYTKAESVLSDEAAYTTINAQSQALLLRAEAAPNHEERSRLYHQLTQETHRNSDLYNEGWYYRGLNDLLEGRRATDSDRKKEANQLFDCATYALEKAHHLLAATNPIMAGLALRYAAEAYSKQSTQQKKEKAIALLDTLTTGMPEIWNAMERPDEIFYLQGVIAANLYLDEGSNTHFIQAEEILKRGIKLFPQGKNASESTLLLGKLYYRKGNFPKAEEVLSHLTDAYSHTPQAGEALFWCARSKRKQGKERSTYKHLFEKVYTDYPESPYAAEAYFSVYRHRDYLQGDRAAAKHLQGMGKQYPDSPLVITAHYLTGLDLKQDRKTPEGKWIRKKNLTAAIDFFQDAELCFDRLYSDGALVDDQLEYFITIRYRAVLERALSNLAIAKESQGAKKRIYLEYAENVLRGLDKDFEDCHNALVHRLTQSVHYHPLHEESSYWLAVTLSNTKSDEAAEEILTRMLEKYRSAKITRGYYLSRTWYQLGMAAMRLNDYELALKHFSQAEDTSKGKVLTADERLDLLIQQSYCHRTLNRTDLAMLILSRVINDDAVSSLRVKAMYLRAELYELQSREELARKQLEATAKKGGPWALKAKTKLEGNYGYL